MQNVVDGISPDLRRMALEEYKYWDPECVLIEAKASGMPLTQGVAEYGVFPL